MLTFGLTAVPSLESVDKNLETLKTYASQAKEAGCTALCFPECFLTGYTPKEVEQRAISRTSKPIETLRSLAQTLNMDLLVGFMEQEESLYYITHGIFLADGSAHYYRKSHLGVREQQVFTPGNSLDVFRLSCGASIGIELCVETHFNDITQSLSLKGARLIFAPFAVPRAAGSREQIWNKYIPARSYDNQVYFACCNQWDEERFGGGILVTAPNGELLGSDYQDTPTLFTFSVPKKSILPLENAAERKHYFPNRRRPELYE